MRVPFLKYLVLSSLVATVNVAAADSYPDRPIRLVVPFAPGGPSDIVARIAGERMGAQLGKPIVVENKAGGGGTVGAMDVVRAQPDGYTLGLATISTAATNPAINPRTPYDPIKDFTPIVNIAATPMLLAVTARFPARDYASFIAEIKNRPGHYNYASPGTGSLTHLKMELFKSLTGTRILHIPYRGSGPALTDTVAGVTQIVLDSTPSILPTVKNGGLVPIAVAAPDRLAELPDVPTFKELGLDEANRMAFFGIVGPKGMSPAIVSQLASTAKAALADPAVRARLEATGALVVGNTPAEFAEQIRAEYASYQRVVVQQKLTLD
jgi:tripartite-type tricarboxylate transporter receptor subunit TctC